MDKVVETYRTNNNNSNNDSSTSGWEAWVGSVKTGGTDEAAFKGSEVAVVAACTGGSSDMIEMAVWLSGCPVSLGDREENSCTGNLLSSCSATCPAGVTGVSDLWTAAGGSGGICLTGGGGSCSGGSSVAASG